MKLSKWLHQYSKNLLPVRIFETEPKQILNVYSDESIYFEQQRNSIKDAFSDYMSAQRSYIEEQDAKTLALKKQTLTKIYKKSDNQLNSLAHKQNLHQNTQNQLTHHNDNTNLYTNDQFNFEQTFTTRYLKSLDGREYLLIGTYHTLQECSVEVMKLFKKFDPDAAVLELCHDRFYQLNDSEINERTQPHRVYNDLEKDPNSLSFLLKSSEFQVAYEAAQRSKKGCQIIPADLNLYYIQNRSKYLRAQCTCNVRQIRDKKSPMKQVLSYFFFGLIPYLLRRLQGQKIDANQQIIKMEKFLNSESRHCITNHIYYEREDNILNSACNYSQGTRVFCKFILFQNPLSPKHLTKILLNINLSIVGFSHLHHLNEMFLKREQALQDYINSNQQSKDVNSLFELNNKNFQSQDYTSLINRNQHIDNIQSQIDYKIKYYNRQKYCAKLE